MNPFRQLLWREWRRNRTILLIPPATFAAWMLFFLGAYTMAPRAPGLKSPGDLLVGVGFLAVWYAAAFGTVLLPFIAANMLAGERADRSAEFIAPLPVSRVVRLTAKVMFLAAVWIATWVPLRSIYYAHDVLEVSRPLWSSSPGDELQLLGVIVSFTFLATAIAWLIASWIGSPVIAATISIAVPIVIYSVPAIVHLPSLRRWEWFQELSIMVGGMPQAFVVLLATVLFTTGSTLYLRRLE